MKSKSAYQKEDFINQMILNSHKDYDEFDIGNISNGEFTFNEVAHFLIMKDLTKEFKDYLVEKREKETGDMFAFQVLRKEMTDTNPNELPFKIED